MRIRCSIRVTVRVMGVFAQVKIKHIFAITTHEHRRFSEGNDCVISPALSLEGLATSVVNLTFEDEIIADLKILLCYLR